MDYPEAIDFAAERIADAVVVAWKNRKPGKMAFGLDFAVVGFNRRATYADGRAVMYGNSNQPDFRGYEAMEDHDLGTLFFLDENDKLLAIVVNIACPSQEVESRLKINADYGVQMKARSPALQTFVVQLTGSVPEIGGYLPTEKAVRGGSYSAIIQSTPVGPEGGQMLVNETLQQAQQLFPK